MVNCLIKEDLSANVNGGDAQVTAEGRGGYRRPMRPVGSNPTASARIHARIRPNLAPFTVCEQPGIPPCVYLVSILLSRPLWY